MRLVPRDDRDCSHAGCDRQQRRNCDRRIENRGVDEHHVRSQHRQLLRRLRGARECSEEHNLGNLRERGSERISVEPHTRAEDQGRRAWSQVRVESRSRATTVHAELPPQPQRRPLLWPVCSPRWTVSRRIWLAPAVWSRRFNSNRHTVRMNSVTPRVRARRTRSAGSTRLLAAGALVALLGGMAYIVLSSGETDSGRTAAPTTTPAAAAPTTTPVKKPPARVGIAVSGVGAYDPEGIGPRTAPTPGSQRTATPPRRGRASTIGRASTSRESGSYSMRASR